MPPAGPQIAAAALLLRDDGRVLLVQHPPAHAQFGGLWSLPMQVLPDGEVMEDAVERLLREVLHVAPGPFEFTETVYVAAAGGERYIVNVFTCAGWEGEPRYSDDRYADAAWADPAAPGALDIVPDLRTWLTGAFSAAGEGGEADAESIAATLAESRRELLAAYQSIAGPLRERPLDGSWSALDLLVHVAAVEAYYGAETRRLLTPGHTWRPFNDAQWEDDYRSRSPETEATALARLEAMRARTDAWLAGLTADELATYGNHAERGVVTIAERLDKIAGHEREHAGQLRMMRDAARIAEAGEGRDAAADR